MLARVATWWGCWCSFLLQCESCGHEEVLHPLRELLLGVLGVVVLELGHQLIQHQLGHGSLKWGRVILIQSFYFTSH